MFVIYDPIKKQYRTDLIADTVEDLIQLSADQIRHIIKHNLSRIDNGIYTVDAGLSLDTIDHYKTDYQKINLFQKSGWVYRFLPNNALDAKRILATDPTESLYIKPFYEATKK